MKEPSPMGSWRTAGSRWLKDQLAARQWRQADLVRALPEAHSGTISRWVTGQQPPSPKYARALAEVFGVDVDLVLGLAGWRPDEDDDDPVLRDTLATLRLLPPHERQLVGEYAAFRLRVSREQAP